MVGQKSCPAITQPLIKLNNIIYLLVIYLVLEVNGYGMAREWLDSFFFHFEVDALVV